MAKQCIPARSRQASKRPAEVNGPSSTLGSFSALARAMNEPAAVLRQRRDIGSCAQRSTGSVPQHAKLPNHGQWRMGSRRPSSGVPGSHPDIPLGGREN